MPDAPNEGLVRAIRRWDATAICINSIIGAGIFGLPTIVFVRIGAWSVVAFVVCALAVSTMVLCFAEVSSRFSGTGGPYLYARAAFGPATGFQVGWLIWLARLTAIAANCNLMLAYLGYFRPSAAVGTGRVIAIAVIMAGLFVVNFVGIRQSTMTSNVLTVAKLVPIAAFIVIGVFFVQPSRLALGPAPSFGAFSGAVLVLVYAYSGFEVAAIPGGEFADPRRDLPRALIIAIASVAVIYVAIQVVAIGTLPSLATSARPLADAAVSFVGSSGGAMISAGAIVSILGNMNATLMVLPRILFAMAEQGELPAVLARTHARFRTPHVAIIVSSLLAFALTVSGTFLYLASISVIARLLSYGATCAALPVLRRKTGVEDARFRAPAGVAVAVVALGLVAWLLTNISGHEARDAGIAVLVGLGLYLISRRAGRRAA